MCLRAHRVHLECCEAQKWGVATPLAARDCRTWLERESEPRSRRLNPSAFKNELPDTDVNRRRDGCRAVLDTPLGYLLVHRQRHLMCQIVK